MQYFSKTIYEKGIKDAKFTLTINNRKLSVENVEKDKLDDPLDRNDYEKDVYIIQTYNIIGLYIWWQLQRNRCIFSKR